MIDSWLNKSSAVDVVLVRRLVEVLVVVLVVVFVVFLVVVVVGLGVVIGILTGVVDVNSLVTKIGRLCMSVKSCEAEILKMLEAASFPAAAFFSVSEDEEVDFIEEDPDEAEASEVNVVVEVGFNFGLLHKLSAPPCKNQGGNGLFVVVTKTRGAHAK